MKENTRTITSHVC